MAVYNCCFSIIFFLHFSSSINRGFPCISKAYGDAKNGGNLALVAIQLTYNNRSSAMSLWKHISNESGLLGKFQEILGSATPALWNSLTRDEKRLFDWYKKQQVVN
jgi:hypothetical protein